MALASGHGHVASPSRQEARRRKHAYLHDCDLGQILTH